MLAVQVHGAGQLTALSRRLKEAGRKDLQKEVRKGIVKATKPMKAAAKASARATLPKAGGLADLVAQSRMTTRVNGRGVRIVAKKKNGQNINLYSMDKGKIRHPVYGHRDRWVDQEVPPEWFLKPMQDGAPGVRREIRAAMDIIERKISG